MYNPSHAAQQQEPPQLPPGWTEHKAPTGHTYYHNKELNKSTYTRPEPLPSPSSAPSAAPAQPQADAFIPSYSAGQFAGGYNASQFQAPPAPGHQRRDQPQPPARHQRRPDGDKPKHKYAIPNCAPWVLIKTKYGRRFVHNTETKESLWRFPEDVMRRVVEFDRRERERQERRERGEPSDIEDDEEEAELAESREVKIVPVKRAEGDGDESEYEEVEVTDSEGEGGEPAKRQRTEDPAAGQEEEDDGGAEEEQDTGPREFTEEDMLWQLQEMQQDEGDDYGQEGEEYYEDEPPLSDEDANALFRDLLTDSHVSPFTPWDRIIESGSLIDDPRYLALATMKARRDCFDAWSRERIAVIKAQREVQAKADPRVAYFQLLDEHASPKLYWPEFKRKFRKEAAMKDMKLPDREREKYYREHVKRLALSKDVLKKEFSALLKEVPPKSLNRDTSLEGLPNQLLTDLRFVSLPKKTRDPMLEAYIATLPSAPADGSGDGTDAAAEAEKKRERERRERALREREERVQEAKLRQNRDLKYGRQKLREREVELERAMKVGKEGLRGHFAVRDEDAEMKDADGDANRSPVVETS